MYLEHFGLTEAPFRITPHTEFFFSGGNRGATLEALMYAIVKDEGIVKVSGEVGSGKTMLCRVLMERLPANVKIVYLANPSLSRDDILYALADELQLEIPPNARSSAVMRALQEQLIHHYGQGKQVVVLIDEAHAMPSETLEEIRLLSNLESNRHKLLQLALFGQPELNDVLARADMRQLKERITHNFVLEPLQFADIASYIEFRLRAAGYKGPMPFSEPAVKAIARASLGLTRRINILADKALLAAFSTGAHQVGPREARAAIQDTEFSAATGRTDQPTGRLTKWLPLIGALTLIGLFVALWLTNTLPPSPFAQGPKDDQTAPAASGSLTGQAPQAPPLADTNNAAPSPAVPDGTPVTTGANPADTQSPAPSTAANDATTSRDATSMASETQASDSNRGPAAALEPARSANAVAPPKPPETRPAQTLPPAVAASTATARTNSTAPALPAEPTIGPLVAAALAAGEIWMHSADNQRWFVQLLIGDTTTTSAMEAYLRSAQRSDVIDTTQLRAYRTAVAGGTRFGIIYGDYASRAEATAAIGKLPAALRGGQPFPRRVEHLR